jgi:hypothetical protein
MRPNGDDPKGCDPKGRPRRHRSSPGLCKPASSLFLASSPLDRNADAIGKGIPLWVIPVMMKQNATDRTRMIPCGPATGSIVRG